MANKDETLLIKRYASRRLYNTETSDYVTLDDIAGFIRSGREVKIVDLKTGDDLTRQYLLQIIAEHESRGENVLPVDVLTDLVRSYTNHATSTLPQFLTMSFDMFRKSQSKFVENMNTMGKLPKVPGFETMQAQQEAFMNAFFGGLGYKPKDTTKQRMKQTVSNDAGAEDLEAIKAQLSELQAKLNKLG